MRGVPQHFVEKNLIISYPIISLVSIHHVVAEYIFSMAVARRSSGGQKSQLQAQATGVDKETDWKVSEVYAGKRHAAPRVLFSAVSWRAVAIETSTLARSAFPGRFMSALPSIRSAHHFS